MVPRRTGCIINVSSGAGRGGMAPRTHYSSSKAALFGFTQALAKEVAPHNIRVNCVVPGAINTELLVNLHHRMAREQGSTYEAMAERAASGSPMRRITEPSEVADFMMYLASDRSSGVTGQNIDINSGSYMHR